MTYPQIAIDNYRYAFFTNFLVLPTIIDMHSVGYSKLPDRMSQPMIRYQYVKGYKYIYIYLFMLSKVVYR